MSIRNFRFDPVTNREIWLERVQVSDENGVPFDLSQADPRLEVQFQPTGATALVAKAGDGQITTRDNGLIEWRFEVERMRALTPGLYTLGLVATLEGVTRQLLTGTIEIQNGFVQ